MQVCFGKWRWVRFEAGKPRIASIRQRLYPDLATLKAGSLTIPMRRKKLLIGESFRTLLVFRHRRPRRGEQRIKRYRAGRLRAVNDPSQRGCKPSSVLAPELEQIVISLICQFTVLISTAPDPALGRLVRQ